MNMNDYIKQDGVGLAKLIKDKEVSPKELVELSYQRLAAVNPNLNAAASTREIAVNKELAHLSETNQTFRGVPFYLKGISQALKGEPLAGGARLFESEIAQETSHFSKRLIDSGLVCLGHSTVPEYALKNITESKLFGPTRSPWNHAYSPGGSSGGAAALVASGVVPLAGASDGGGSIRIPASFTSLVGLKPTRGRTAVGPGVGRQWHGAAIDFALSRTVRDSARLLDISQVVQEEAAFQTPLFAGSYEEEIKRPFHKKLKIGYTTESPVKTLVSAEAKKAVMNVVKWLESEGHEVVETNNNIDGEEMMRNYYLMNSGEISAMTTQIEQSIGRKVTADDVEIETWLLNEAGRSVSAAEFSLSLASWDTAAEQMKNFHQTYDLYLTPAASSVAPKVGELTHSKDAEAKLREQIKNANAKEQQEIIYEMFLPSLTYTPFTQLANLTGQPAISVPTHLAENGLPIGVHFMARKGDDLSLLKIASQLEFSDLWVGTKSLL